MRNFVLWVVIFFCLLCISIEADLFIAQSTFILYYPTNLIFFAFFSFTGFFLFYLHDMNNISFLEAVSSWRNVASLKIPNYCHCPQLIHHYFKFGWHIVTNNYLKPEKLLPLELWKTMNQLREVKTANLPTEFLREILQSHQQQS